MAKKKEHEKIIRISRRTNLKLWQQILIKVGFILFAFLLCGILSNIVAPGSFGEFYEYMFNGTFYNGKIFLTLMWQTLLLFIIALAITPAFKMKFWNIGAEGQCLMGGLGALIVLKFIAPHIPNFFAIILELLFAIIFAAIWGVIPAIFKAQFNTNETLFTLMMNYIAMGIVAACVMAWSTTGSAVLGIINNENHEGWLPYIGNFGNSYILNIIIIVIISVAVWLYLRFSKHGYELSVVGGSQNTARYIGINVKSVIIRTMLLSGGVCGVAGFLMVTGASHTISSSLVNGRGFTAILISWLGGFNVPMMAVYSFLVSFVSIGSSNAAAWIGYSSTVSNVLTGVFFLLIIASSFFVNFKVHIRWPFKKKKKAEDEKIEEKKEESK